MKFPTYENDCYELDDGEAIHLEYPDTFEIPDKKERENLKKGALVKLVFRMEETKGSNEVSVERMWVELTEKIQDFYIGVLDNTPSGSDCVKAGQTVYFEPRHIIDIYK